MSTFQVFSAHTIYSRENCPINKDDYSKFKYGSKSVARKFGRELGEKLAEELLPNLNVDDQLVIASAPYKFIPTASFHLKNYVIAALNPHLVARGMKPIEETKVTRDNGYNTDYGSMTAEERRSVIGEEKFHVDAEFLRGKIVLFLDDIKITGVHQELMEEMILRLSLFHSSKKIFFIYYAVLNDPKSDATIEDHLNLYSTKNLLDLNKIIQNDEFLLNTRNVKYILKAPHVDCVNFLEYQSDGFRQSLYDAALGNSYHSDKNFKLNFQYLEHLVNSNL